MKVLHLSGYFCFSLLLLFVACLPKSAMSGNIYKQLTAVKCDSLIKANETNPNFVILDVRTASEWSGSHLLGSINHSTGNTTFDAELAALPRHKLYLLHCQSGGRSAGAFTKMKNLGFATVYEMIGGLISWNASGLPTTTVAGPKLMIVSVLKSTKSGINDSTVVTVTNRANSKLQFSNIIFKDNHTVINNFDLAKTLNGAEDYAFLIIHPSGLGDSTKVTLESNGGNIGLAIKNSVSVNTVSHPLADLKIYPNPASDRLNFNIDFGLIDNISIFDLAGRLVCRVKSQNHPEIIDVSAFNEGIYLARITIHDKIITRKIVISR